MPSVEISCWRYRTIILLWISMASIPGSAVSAFAEAPRAEIVTQLGHSSSIASVAFSPDGQTVVTGSNDGTARLWDAENGRELDQLRRDDWVVSVAFSPDGRTVLMGTLDKTAWL